MEGNTELIRYAIKHREQMKKTRRKKRRGAWSVAEAWRREANGSSMRYL